MIKVAAVLAAYLLVGYWEAAPLIRHRRRGEALLVAALILLGAWYSAGLIAGWPLLNPARVVAAIFRPAARLAGAP